MIDEIPNELLEALYHDQEEVYLEYKGDIPWTDIAKKLEIIKTIFAMANESGGGIVIIGVDKDGKRAGLSDANFGTFTHDQISSFLNNKSNQKIQCKIEKHKHIDKEDKVEKNFVFIQISESKEFPVIYTSSHALINPQVQAFSQNIGLRHGALYIRNKSEVGNKEIESMEEWRLVARSLMI
ncbi:MAG: hypothetical protein CEN90_226 [Parcubacteria group bacterium Licking1014_17]|nr:MAG: hypothetical protein CEN90_226 [Parcubacteria group bacterium Licking1014_17]